MNGLRNYLKTSFSKSVLIDTGVLVDFLVGESKARDFFEEFVYSGQLTPVVSAHSVSELFMAARNKKEETDLERWVGSVFDIADVDYAVAKAAGLLKRGNGIRVGDTIIAATASVLRIPLVTTIPDSYRRAQIKTFKAYA
jgi:predicted nucleic acid-binding protein